MDENLYDSYEYIEDDYIENDSTENNSFFPPHEYILILILILIILLIIFEKIFKSIFLFFIPSTFFLIIAMIILNLFILRYIIITTIFIGKNPAIKFYFRSFVAKKKAKLLIKYLTNFNSKIDKILNNEKTEEIQNQSQLLSKSKIIQKYIDIYETIQNKYGTMSNYSKNFYTHLLSLKNKIQNSTLQDIYNKIEKNEQFILTNENKNDLQEVKSEVEQIKNILIDFRESKSLCPNLSNIKGIIYNDILQSKEFTRETILIKRQNSQKLIINTQDDTKLDCLLITSDHNNLEGMIQTKNLIIVCGPNLIPYDNLISSWDIDTIYTNNNIDLLFWNYRGYGFSEGSADFDNICYDIISIYDYIIANYKYNKIGVYGFSIGGIAACHLANNRNINLLIADRTFGSSLEILEHFYLNKYIAYLGKILFITYVDNTTNYLSAKCNKIMLNDVQDQIIFDSVSLKTSIAKHIIYKIFNETNPEFNVRNIKSKNILDYALEPEQVNQFYSSFKYIISFLKSKNQRKNIDINNSINDKIQLLNEDIINNIENININNSLKIKEVLDKFYDKIKTLFSNYFCPNNSFDTFLDYQSKKIHFNNYFNSLVVFGPEDISLKNYSICSTKYTENEINNFINDIEEILNLEEISKISQHMLYQKLNYFKESLKNVKIFVNGLNMEEIENKWLRPMKGLLIPLNCGHTSFYYEDRTINTIIYLIKETFNNNDSIAIDPPLIENNI